MSRYRLIVVLVALAVIGPPAPPPAPAGAGDVWTVAAAGDISCAQGPDGTTLCRDRATSNVIVRRDFIDRVITLGDNQYEHGELANFWRYYDPTWGRFRSMTRPSPGNHDLGPGYFEYWGWRAGPSNRGYYAFTLGTWRLYSLDSVDPSGPGTAQYRWLRDDLRDRPHPCVLAYWHHPRWSSGEHGSQRSMDPVWDLLFAHGADVVLAGHDHTYERFAHLDGDGHLDEEAGIRSFVVGTGGRSHYGFDRVLRRSQVRDNSSYGVLLLWLRPGSYRWKFVPATGAFTDSGTDLCRTGP